MTKTQDYRFVFRITNEDGETVAAGSTYLTPTSITQFGDCESVDDEVGKVLRAFHSKWLKDQIADEEELPEDVDFDDYTGAGDPLDNDR